jgi:hypothetical protein
MTVMGVHPYGAISSPFAGAPSAMYVGEFDPVNAGKLPNYSLGEGKRFYANFTQQGFRIAGGYLYYQTSTIQIVQKLNGQLSRINSFANRSAGTFQLFTAIGQAVNGSNRILVGVAQKSVGQFRTLFLAEVKGQGRSIWVNNFQIQDWGQFNLELTHIVSQVSGRYFVQTPFTSTVKGLSRVLIGASNGMIGLSGRHVAITTKVINRSRVLASFSTSLKGKYGSSTSFTGIKMSGSHRRQNSTTSGYVAYVGAGSPPNFNQPPAVYSSTLPINVPLAPPLSGTLTYHVVIRARNSHGVESQNQKPFRITLDAAGNRVLAPITAPTNVSLRADPTSNILVAAEYPNLGVVEDPANSWYVWLSLVPTEPVDESFDPDNPTASFPVVGSRFLGVISGMASGVYNCKIALFRSEDGLLGPIVNSTVELTAAPPEPIGVPGMSIMD